MVTLSKKRKQLLAVTAIALVLIVTLPCVVYAESPSVSTGATWGTRLLGARGIAVERVDSQTITAPANFTLVLEPTEVNATIIKFNVLSGTVNVNGTAYTITAGNGAVVRDRHAFLLQAQGTGPAGESVTLKLAGRYFWMWGHLYVARIAGVLQSDNAKTLLLLRAAIRV